MLGIHMYMHEDKMKKPDMYNLAGCDHSHLRTVIMSESDQRLKSYIITRIHFSELKAATLKNLVIYEYTEP